MFGSYRYVLAHMVILSHFWIDLSLWAGPYAVFSFFLLSGFLMSQVLETTYPTGVRGTARFFTNRALRIFPPYWAALALALLAVAVIPDAASHLNFRQQWPRDAMSWLQNVAIFGLNRELVRLVPPAWSLDLELCWYALMPLGLTRNDWLRAAWLAAGVAWAGLAVANDWSFQDRYSALGAAALPFALGATVQRFREPLRRAIPWRRHLPIAASLYLVNAALPGVAGYSAFGIAFYASLACSAYLVVALSQLSPRAMGPRAARWDRLLGDLSYPVFLCHFALGGWLLCAGLAEGKGPSLLAWGIVAANLGALAIHFGIERPLVRVRDRIRGRSAR